MKIHWPAILLTLGLYAATVATFLIADRFGYRHGANDMGNGVLVFGLAALVIGFFFIRTIYQAVQIDPSYWLVVGLHLLCIAIFI